MTTNALNATKIYWALI